MLKFVDLSDNPSAVKQFLERVSANTIYQDPAYLATLESVKNNRPFCYGASKDGELVATIAGTIITNYFWPISALTSRAVIIGGPVVLDNDQTALNFLLGEVSRALKKHVIYTQIRSHQAWGQLKDTFIQNQFEYVPHLNILVDLDRTEEEIVQGISKNKRKNVRKSRNKGVVVKEVVDRAHFEAGIDLVLDTYRRASVPGPATDLLFAAFDKLRSTGNFIAFGCFFEDRLIGVRMELLNGNTVFDWYAGSAPEDHNKYPNDLLIYHVLLWAKQNGFSTFDFGGAGKPNVPYGVRDHKLKFGGNLYEPGRFEKVHSKLKFALGKMGLYLFKKLK